jgi:hypothetical protein
MKKKLFYSLGIPLLLASCSGGGGTSPTAKNDTCSDLMRFVDESYKNYVNKVEKNVEERFPSTTAQPVSDKVMEMYFEAFKKQFPKPSSSSDQSHTYTLKIDKETIAFYLKYLDEMKADTLAFTFAKYDTTGFAAKGYKDNIFLQRGDKMKNRFSVGVGLWNQGKFAPLRIDRLSFAFYDDWHNEDP